MQERVCFRAPTEKLPAPASLLSGDGPRGLRVPSGLYAASSLIGGHLTRRRVGSAVGTEQTPPVHEPLRCGPWCL